MNEALQHSEPRSLKKWLKDCYQGSSWLTITGYLMFADTLISLIGLALDRTTVMGDPTWLKPLKFGISTTLFSLTVAWIIGQLHRTRRFAALLGGVLSVALTVEIVLIDMQAARHTSSHFNIATRFDGAVFQIMGIFIAMLYLSTALLFAAVCFERFRDPALAWAIRLSLVLALAGMTTGVLMTLPTPEQQAKLHAGGGLPRAGAHTVGAPDGGPELPITGWSADHGDLRIAHFIGLHAMQLILLAWWLTCRRHWHCSQQLALVVGVATSIAAVYAVVLIQALHGQPFLHPDLQTIAAWVIWIAANTSLLIWTLRQNQHNPTLPSEAN